MIGLNDAQSHKCSMVSPPLQEIMPADASCKARTDMNINRVYTYLPNHTFPIAENTKNL